MAAGSEAASVERLLTAAKDTMAKAKFCWAVTTAENGQANARPMGRIPSAPGDDAWIVWFMTRRTSRKALEIGRAGRLTVVFQHDADDSYVTLIGRSEIITDRAVIRPRWQKDWNLFFADGAEDENAVLVRTEAMRLELWVRGVTAEPFGARTTILERDESREWREVPR
jgi:general stress protein 26